MVRVINRLKYVVINMIPIKIRMKIKLLLSKKKFPTPPQNIMKIIVAIAADYGNLGDVAITHAQIKFLKDHFPHSKIITIYVDELYRLSGMKKFITPQDLITIIGGGNMGDVYKGLETQRRYIINLFPNNKIISFPQSIHFIKKKTLNKSIKIYSKHQNLYLFAREPKSYEMMKKHFKNNFVYLVPDIVLYLNKVEPELERQGITLSLRHDIEKKISTKQQENLVEEIIKKFQKVVYYDTSIDNFSVEIAEEELNKILQTFKKSKVVITDRLHGMIFCAITKTPCIVFPNSNHKISSTYHKWLSNLNYINYVENFDEKKIMDQIDNFFQLTLEKMQFDLDYSKQFHLLLDALNE